MKNSIYEIGDRVVFTSGNMINKTGIIVGYSTRRDRDCLVKMDRDVGWFPEKYSFDYEEMLGKDGEVLKIPNGYYWYQTIEDNIKSLEKNTFKKFADNFIKTMCV